MRAGLWREQRSQEPWCLPAWGLTRLDLLNYISHGVRKNPQDDPTLAPGGDGEEGPAGSRDPLEAYASNLTERARDGKLDPVIGPAHEMKRALEGLCRRRHNNPPFLA